jgi:hypothetical protein
MTANRAGPRPAAGGSASARQRSDRRRRKSKRANQQCHSDLYRYSAPGVRSFSIVDTTSPYAYFSINGGNTVLSYFNQTSGGSDYGDWLSDPIHAGYGPQVQDAFGYPGPNPALGVNELTALNVIGYNLVVPEPASVTLLALGMAFLVYCHRRRFAPSWPSA